MRLPAVKKTRATSYFAVIYFTSIILTRWRLNPSCNIFSTFKQKVIGEFLVCLIPANPKSPPPLKCVLLE